MEENPPSNLEFVDKKTERERNAELRLEMNLLKFAPVPGKDATVGDGGD